MAQKAIIRSGGKQYLVTEGETLEIDLVHGGAKNLNVDALLLINGDKIDVGQPVLTDIKVTAEVVNEDIRADKVVAIRYKAKKRVHKTHGHRQHQTRIKITKIAAKS